MLSKYFRPIKSKFQHRTIFKKSFQSFCYARRDEDYEDILERDFTKEELEDIIKQKLNSLEENYQKQDINLNSIIFTGLISLPLLIGSTSLFFIDTQYMQQLLYFDIKLASFQICLFSGIQFSFYMTEHNLSQFYIQNFLFTNKKAIISIIPILVIIGIMFQLGYDQQTKIDYSLILLVLCNLGQSVDQEYQDKIIFRIKRKFVQNIFLN